jgi:SH3 domain-containing protein
MGQLKLRPDAGAASGRYPADVLGDPKPIAQRFAHSADSRPAPPRRSEPLLASPQPATAPAEDLSAFRTRLLLVGLSTAAVVPSLILVSLALGLIAMPGSESAVAVSARQAAAPSAVLSLPGRIEARAGETASFPIALDGTDGMPPRSVVAITGLPRGSNFSEGRPYGGTEWNLKPDQIGDLSLVLPGDADGEFKLGVALIGPDGSVIATAETLLAIASAPAPVRPPAVEASAGLPAGGEAALAVVPDAAGGNSAEAQAEPETETAAVTTGDTQAETVEPTIEEATAPTSDVQPNTLGQAEVGETGLGTVKPAMFVNLREAPSSSSSVLSVVAKGAKLAVLDRKRGWVQVTDPETGNKGWIYSGLLAGEAKPHARRKRAAPVAAEPKSESFWSRVGGWLSP